MLTFEMGWIMEWSRGESNTDRPSDQPHVISNLSAVYNPPGKHNLILGRCAQGFPL